MYTQTCLPEFLINFTCAWHIIVPKPLADFHIKLASNTSKSYILKKSTSSMDQIAINPFLENSLSYSTKVYEVKTNRTSGSILTNRSQEQALSLKTGT